MGLIGIHINRSVEIRDVLRSCSRMRSDSNSRSLHLDLRSLPGEAAGAAASFEEEEPAEVSFMARRGPSGRRGREREGRMWSEANSEKREET